MTPTDNLEAGAGDLVEVADALDEFADIDECEGGNPHVIATERRAAILLREAAAQLAAVTAENARLREALEPFASHAAAYDPEEEDDQSAAWQSVFDIGDLRRTRAALSQEAPE